MSLKRHTKDYMFMKIGSAALIIRKMQIQGHNSTSYWEKNSKEILEIARAGVDVDLKAPWCIVGGNAVSIENSVF